MQNYDVIIIGAGASGLMCALTAGQRGCKVLLLDHSNKVGNKILVSGGGCSNFTNLHLDAGKYLSNNRHFCKSALSRFDQYAFIALMEKYKVPYHEREHGQLFCDGKSNQIVNLLLDECRIGGVKIKTKCAINNIARNEQYKISTNVGDYTSESLVIATGGLSMPKTGATGFGYDVAKQFGLRVLTRQPGLVPLTLDKHTLSACSVLSGVSVDAEVSCNGYSFRDALLFTHKGLSGPAILQISNYWKQGDGLIIDLLPDINLADEIIKWQKEHPKTELKSLISELLTKRLTKLFLDLYHKNKPVNQYNAKEIEKSAEIFHQWRIVPSCNAGYFVAEVTNGGVDTEEISSKTFETKNVKKLYFIGEVLDVTGWLGGFNLQWAWSSGYCAGQYV
ncbi:MAG: NAD(P)/FAD-dependent oxidoreductase [Candidatus Anammoxibacter sp.]